MRTDATSYESLTANQLIYSETLLRAPQLSNDKTSLGFTLPDGLSTSFALQATSSLPVVYRDAQLNSATSGLALGLNKVAARHPVIGLFPGLDIGADSRGCNESLGAFYVHEYALTSSGDLAKMAVDFSLQCDGGPTTQGAIRYQSSVPNVVNRVYAVAGPDFSVPEGRAVVVDGSKSWSPASPIASISWTQESGPALDLSGCQQLICKTFVPLLPSGGGVARLRLTVEAQNGMTDSDTVDITLLANTDRQTRFELWGGGFVSSNGDLLITSASGRFYVPDRTSTGSIYQDQTAERVDLRIAGMSQDNRLKEPLVTMMSAAGTPLTAGFYHTPLNSGGFYALATPSAVVSSDGHACGNQVGDMYIGEIVRDATDYGNITSLSAYFAINCVVVGVMERQANYVRVWINHQPVNLPVASIAGNTSATPGTAVSLSSSGSAATVGQLVTRIWRIIYAPSGVTINIASSTDATVNIPASVLSGAQIVVALEVTDSKGDVGTALQTITVR